MGLTASITSAAGAVAAACVARILADDLKEWMPQITAGLVELAVRQLPPCKRAHYREEWNAHASEVPGILGKLAHGLTVQFAALRTREEFARTTMLEWHEQRKAAIESIEASLKEIEDLLGNFPSIELCISSERMKHINVSARHVAARGDELAAANAFFKDTLRRKPALGMTMARAELFVLDLYVAKPWHRLKPSRLFEVVWKGRRL